MATIKLSDIRREADREHGDVLIALTDETDEAGQPVDAVALVKTIRLGAERRDRVKALRAKMDNLRADTPEVAAQRATANAARNRADTAGEGVSEGARREMERRAEVEERKLDELAAEAEDAQDESVLERQMRDLVAELVVTVARKPEDGKRLIAAVSTEDAPDGDLGYLMEVFRAYQRGGAAEGGDDTGEASPSQT